MRTLWYLRHHYMVRLIDLGARHTRAQHPLDRAEANRGRGTE